MIAPELALKLGLDLDVILIPDPVADFGEYVEDGDGLFRCPCCRDFDGNGKRQARFRMGFCHDLCALRSSERNSDRSVASLRR